jgi:hypothetical protein
MKSVSLCNLTHFNQAVYQEMGSSLQTTPTPFATLPLPITPLRKTRILANIKYHEDLVLLNHLRNFHG